MRPAHAFGFRVKSGFAVAIALRGPASAPIAAARRVVMMSDPKVPGSKQPYHHGFYQTEDNTREIARRVKIIERCAEASVEALLCESWLEGTSFGCAAIVVGSTIDPTKVGNPHIRAHAHEGQLFRVVWKMRCAPTASSPRSSSRRSSRRQLPRASLGDRARLRRHSIVSARP